MTEPPIPQVRPVEHTLLSTDDAMVWAQEFCRIFRGRMIIAEGDESLQVQGFDLQFVDEGGMVAWFANAMQTAVNVYERRKLHEKGELTPAEAFIKKWEMDHPPVDEPVDEEDAAALEEQFLEGFKDGRP